MFGSKLHSPRPQPFTSFWYCGWIGSFSLHLGCFSDTTCSKHAIPAWRTHPVNVPDCRTDLQPFHTNSPDIWDISHISTGSGLNWKWPYCLTYILIFTQPSWALSPHLDSLGRLERPKTLNFLWHQFSPTLLICVQQWKPLKVFMEGTSYTRNSAFCHFMCPTTAGAWH